MNVTLIAGSVAGMSSVLVCHPLDTIRTRLQTSPTTFNGSFFYCIRKTIQKEGIQGFYKGFTPVFFSQAIYKSIIFTISNQISKNLTQYTSNNLIISMASGGIAGGLNAFVVTPVELIRNRLQIQYEVKTRKYRNSVHCLKSVIQSEGILKLWTGLSTAILRDSIGVACYFLGYQTMLHQLQCTSMPSYLTIFLSGACGGVSFWLVALPFDTVKTLVQVNEQNHNLIKITTELIQKSGISSLFRGWQAAFSRGIPSAGITFLTFDFVKCRLEN